jgi:hypothetical protein
MGGSVRALGERRGMKERNPKLMWGITVGFFLCLALWPLWSVRFPPLQDYPEQLFHSQILSAHGNPAFDYDRYYEAHLRPVYAGFYLATWFFAKFAPIEIAGKLALSLYPILIAAVVIRLGRRLGKGVAPWGALLFFPFAFNQQYFLGNVNYMLSLPILVLTLFDFEDLLGGELRAWTLVRHSLGQCVLFLTHPLSFLVYVSMAVVGAIRDRRRARKVWAKLAAVLGVAFLLFVAYWVENQSTPAPEVPADPRVGWLSPLSTFKFFALMFNGMHGSTGAEVLTSILWGGIGAVVLGAMRVERTTRWILDVPRGHLTWLAMAILGIVFLPYQIGSFSYINVRIASVFYFLIALVVSQVRFRGWLACGLVGLVSLCTLDSVAKQARISAESREILPIVLQIPPQSRILPLAFDCRSPELDRIWFAPHLHDHAYYHILVGGGFNPYLIRSSIHPVHYKEGQERPSPGEFAPEHFSWRLHAADYQYFLIRGAPEGVAERMSEPCKEISVSGKWMLFQRIAR